MRASGETVLTGEKESRVGGGGGRGPQAEHQICSHGEESMGGGW